MRFVVSYINFYDNELKSEKVMADSLLEATKLAYLRLQGVEYEDNLPQKIESIKQEAFNCDGMVNAIQI